MITPAAWEYISHPMPWDPPHLDIDINISDYKGDVCAVRVFRSDHSHTAMEQARQWLDETRKHCRSRTGEEIATAICAVPELGNPLRMENAVAVISAADLETKYEPEEDE